MPGKLFYIEDADDQTLAKGFKTLGAAKKAFGKITGGDYALIRQYGSMVAWSPADWSGPFTVKRWSRFTIG